MDYTAEDLISFLVERMQQNITHPKQIDTYFHSAENMEF